MQRALRAGWPCAWPILSSHGLFPREGPTTVPRGLVNLWCQGMRLLARGPIGFVESGGRPSLADRPAGGAHAGLLIRFVCDYAPGFIEWSFHVPASHPCIGFFPIGGATSRPRR